MMFTESELRLLLYCADGELRARRQGKPPGVTRLLVQTVRHLQLELAVSAPGHDSEGGSSDSDHDAWIGSEQAAAILRWHVRKVRRHQADLGGRKAAGGALEFRESVVREYMEGLSDGGTAA